MSTLQIETNEIDELLLGTSEYRSRAETIIKTPHLELIRLVLPAGKEIPRQSAPGEIIVQCLEGRVDLTMMGESQELTAGHLLFVHARESHSITAIEDSSLLVTLMSSTNNAPEPFDVVQEASEESFPASDSPAY